MAQNAGDQFAGRRIGRNPASAFFLGNWRILPGTIRWPTGWLPRILYFKAVVPTRSGLYLGNDSPTPWNSADDDPR